MSDRAASLPRELMAPKSFHEEGLRDDQGTRFLLLDGELWFVGESMASRIVHESSPPYCEATNANAENRRDKAYMELIAWTTIHIMGKVQPVTVHGGPPVDKAAVARVAKRSIEQQHAWVRERMRIIKETPCG
ncbi:hypothetical protein HRW14_28265 [Streptomyces lunaelactis]|uniref:hypothetical protein n=1 Tax=Streptomyces lunaelactis TaxID=1535768 RepID=UPI001584727B|nr:hypothetical protein [Streptomyces lunaelactis]NUK54097.1 hypothetical protein [Streptomyces lunaelactis]NUK66770.1 hypothetical protein [Streptomyces lunaelactis]